MIRRSQRHDPLSTAVRLSRLEWFVPLNGTALLQSGRSRGYKTLTIPLRWYRYVAPKNIPKLFLCVFFFFFCGTCGGWHLFRVHSGVWYRAGGGAGERPRPKKNRDAHQTPDAGGRLVALPGATKTTSATTIYGKRWDIFMFVSTATRREYVRSRSAC